MHYQQLAHLPTTSADHSGARLSSHRVIAARNLSTWSTILVLLLASVLVPACHAPSTEPSAITVVATATSAEPRPALPDSLTTDLTKVARRSKKVGDATIHLIISTTGETTTKDLTPLRSNSQVQHTAADADRQIRTSVGELTDTIANARADRPGLDLLGLLDRASQLPGDLHIVSSGITTVAPVDLRIIGWNPDVDSVIDSIVRQGHLPTLSGRHVTFHGLGIAAGSQPSLPPFARTLVERLWTGICQRAEAASCVVAHDAPSAAAPMATMPVPVVPVPDAITEGGCPVWASLSDAVLHFSPGSAALPANADDALRPIAEAAARCDVRSIDVTGHIADTGAGRDDGDLSGQRARAVADRLAVLGLQRDQIGMVAGHGATEPVTPNFTSGVFDEAKAAQNRRVELTFDRGRR
ncbi:OmpA family protein [Nocardia brasiliensis]|uniref:OmpA family protein n=1 Tax=Nocardia brasiliensis TaxID=37326 RepID=UPI002453A3B2|nr:OmpA family protein [Nocardia brasiliensis]